MPVIQVKDTQHILKPGQTRIGAGPGVDVSVSDEAALGLQDVKLHRQAWRSLAELAERRGDGDSAGQAWKRAASD